ncbi:SOS response-associated peptidase [Phytohalomonas tamaricis]|uniref:SOS response-associated peptidase n=1 Tax=Phytohalomonas tamaricis TaxID=2081032 RepID=UPI000D0BD84D|nr:SOS response-associated peptidase [Phytohalomonas tamaricis]
MAGRLHIAPFDLHALLPELDAEAGLITSPNLAPRHRLAIIRHEAGHSRLAHAFWGLTPSWLKVLDHAPHCARAESLNERRMFREAFVEQRALIPVSGVYIWKTQPRMKQPFLVTRSDRTPLLLAGIWTRYRLDTTKDSTGAFDSTALITVEANTLLAPLTDRFPAVIDAQHAERWLAPTTSLEEAQAMLSTTPLDLLGAFPVSKRVDNPACQEWSCAHPTGLMQTIQSAAQQDT